MLVDPYRFSIAERALAESVLWLDARYAVPGEQIAVNRGTGGAALNAKYGSVNTGARIVGGAAVLPGTTGNYLSTPDVAALDTTGDIDIRCRVAMADWTPAAIRTLVSKYSTTGNQRSYKLDLLTTGVLQLAWTTLGTGASLLTASSTVAVAAIDGTSKWVRATLDVDNGAAGRDIKFWTSDDGATWTQLGTTVTQAGTTSIFSGTGVLSIGAMVSAEAQNLAGSIYAAQVRYGIGGTVVFDMDLTTVPDESRSFLDATGKGVTLNSTSYDTNDPQVAPHTGQNYAYLPGGTAANDLACNGTVVGRDVANFEFVTKVRFGNEAGEQWLCGLGNWAGAYGLYLASTGVMGFMYRTTGMGTTLFRTTSGGQIIRDTPIWIRHRRNDATGTYTLELKYSDEVAVPTSGWTTIDTFVSDPGANLDYAVAAASQMLVLGATRRAAFPARLSGPMYYAHWGATGSAPIFVFNAATDITSAAATSFTATTGQIVTVDRATSGRKTALVTRPIWLFGTDDYMEIADNALLNFAAGDSFTMMVVVRQWATASGAGQYIGKGTTISGSAGYVMTFARNIGLADTVVANLVVAINSPANGVLSTIVGVRNVATDRIYGFMNATATAETVDTTTLTLANADPFRIMRTATSAYMDAELVAVAVWRRVLTTDEIAAINTYYQTA